MAYIVALTGGIGSGKSTVAQGFAALGATIVDADVIARQVVAPGQPALAAIVEYFGREILQPDGTLNRNALRERIFSNPEDKRWLNALLHPLIQQETRRQLAAVTTPYALWVVPLLVENRLQGQAQRILVVDVPLETQLQRTMARDGVSRAQAQNILASQASREQRLACADDIIDNNSNPSVLAPRIAALHQHYLTLAASATDRTTHNE
ncbi:dephospho-CoA kinase [Dickeya dadantii]|uniref:Dephospho-CoA kinase n=1 Tax=Dickeya dadantii (strain 3937) TaxID=198628 RepID=E0SG63_DICD3|nr:dephospho-CoA kinase [Dickeya dadantii]ADN00031.1 dephospho-CoA kinase [Dickeya dadantii 3937]NPE59483.1 dephospho-CoA kinase [Dickeya dadantii]NPE70829.1 dephospho-CoA kinase [Dickeya dadantii]OOC11668.1 dephospho-CoA kinase [Dickeya dadantii]